MSETPTERRWRWPDWGQGLTEDATGQLHYDRPRMSREALVQATIHASDAPFNGLLRLSQLVDLGVVDLAHPAMVGVVAAIWARARHPQDVVSYSAETCLRRDRLAELFTLNGFTVNLKPADRPTEPVVAWRACVPSVCQFDKLGHLVAVGPDGRAADPFVAIADEWDGRTGPTWNLKRAIAAKAASSWGSGVRMHRTTVEPDALLAILGNEVVVDPAGLSLDRIETVAQR